MCRIIPFVRRRCRIRRFVRIHFVAFYLLSLYTFCSYTFCLFRHFVVIPFVIIHSVIIRFVVRRSVVIRSVVRRFVIEPKSCGLAVEDARMILCAVLAEPVGGVAGMQEFYSGGRAASREVVGAGADVVSAADLDRSGGRP